MPLVTLLQPAASDGVTQSRNHAGLYWQKVKDQGAVYQCPDTPNILSAVNSAIAFSSGRAQQHQIVETTKKIESGCPFPKLIWVVNHTLIGRFHTRLKHGRWLCAVRLARFNFEFQARLVAASV